VLFRSRGVTRLRAPESSAPPTEPMALATVGASVYAALTVAMAIGSVGGALLSGARNRVTPRLLVGAAIAFGLVETVVALAPALWLQVGALVVLGAISVTFTASAQSTIQLTVEPALRGRVMALYSVVFLGSTPIGAPLVGWLAEAAGARVGLLVGAAAALVTGIIARAAYARDWREHRAGARATVSA